MTKNCKIYLGLREKIEKFGNWKTFTLNEGKEQNNAFQSVPIQYFSIWSLFWNDGWMSMLCLEAISKGTLPIASQKLKMKWFVSARLKWDVWITSQTFRKSYGGHYYENISISRVNSFILFAKGRGEKWPEKVKIIITINIFKSCWIMHLLLPKLSFLHLISIAFSLVNFEVKCSNNFIWRFFLL